MEGDSDSESSSATKKGIMEIPGCRELIAAFINGLAEDPRYNLSTKDVASFDQRPVFDVFCLKVMTSAASRAHTKRQIHRRGGKNHKARMRRSTTKPAISAKSIVMAENMTGGNVGFGTGSYEMVEDRSAAGMCACMRAMKKSGKRLRKTASGLKRRLTKGKRVQSQGSKSTKRGQSTKGGKATKRGPKRGPKRRKPAKSPDDDGDSE